ncbi:pseudaminic acid synthase [Candidatus Pelagibacter bacterium]|jgi:pseudaminic acid synthase|nr:pseudaminic acid synthase [Candidatus Pelagibacter bacterium]
MNKKKPFFVAEISANHCGDFNLAKRLIKCAKLNGADAVKLQTYTPDTMTVKSNKKYFKIKNGLWKGYQLWDLYNKAQTPLHWHKDLFKYAKKIGIIIFSSPFDESAVDFLEKLKCPIYKVASFEMTDIPLIKKIAKTKKPIIISTGMANLKEIEETFNIAKKYGSNDICLLYCVSKYPSETKDFNLNNIKILKEKFKCKVGLSDHSKDNRVAIAAVAAGAEIIEKHIALDNQKKGLDIEFSLKGKEIKHFRRDIDLASDLLGKSFFFRNSSEKNSKIFRRSIFTIKKINKGEKFNVKNIRRIRPGYGLPPKYYEKLINKKSPINLDANEPLDMRVLKKI